MSRYSERENAPILDAAAHWAQHCLVEDGSLFSNTVLWTGENLALLDRYFVQRPDAGSGDFFEKLAGQLGDAPPDASRLMAELLWCLFLFPSNTGPSKKREGIAQAWRHSGSELDLQHPMLSDSVLAGIGSAGTAFNTQRWREINFAVALFTALKQKPASERATLVKDYEHLSRWLETFPRDGDRQFRHMLRFLLCPDQVERMSSNGDRRRVLAGYGVARKKVTRQWTDRQLDDALLALRRKLEAEKGTKDLDFYLPGLVERWKDADAPAPTMRSDNAFDRGYAELRARFLSHMPGLQTFASHARLTEHERAYKDELVAIFNETIAPPVASSDWLAAGTAAIDILTRPLKHASNKPQNIVGWRYVDLVRKLDARRRAEFGRSVAELIDEEHPISERIEGFVEALQAIAGDEHRVLPAAQRSMAGFYLALADPKQHLFLKTVEIQQALRVLDPGFQWNNDELTGTDVIRVQSLAKRVFDRLQAEGWQPRDMIDVQSFLWVASNYKAEDRIAEVDEDEGDDEGYSVAPPRKSVATVRPVNRILFGPPGTGKTYALQKMLDEEYTEAAATVDPETWRAEQIASQFGALTWWEALGAALYDLGRPATVPELASHPFLVAVAAAKGRIKGVRETIWGTLQHHTGMESQTVNIAQRLPPFVFDKLPDSRWKLVDDSHERLAEVIETVDAIKQGPKPAGDSVRRYDFVTFHQSFSYEDFIEGLTPVVDDDTWAIRYQVKKGAFLRLCERARSDPAHAYAMVIDEINRGNVSKVFGELIALIETDKRSGMANALSSTLPYSGEAFSVPSNVHLIGSMNTADRSLAGLDIALRRRFEFVEMPPNSDEIKGKTIAGIDLAAMLDDMNARISVLLDPDHRLGHAYFINLDSSNEIDGLAAIFRRQILPLLQEYFFDDWQRIAWVLNDHRKPADFCFVEKYDLGMSALFGSNAEVPVDAKLWRINEKAFHRPQSYLGILSNEKV